MYVADAVQLADKMLEAEAWGRIIECGTGVGTSVIQLVEQIKRITDSSSEPTHLPMRLGEPEHAMIVADSSELYSLFPGIRLTSLSDGISQTIGYYSKAKVAGALNQVG